MLIFKNIFLLVVLFSQIIFAIEVETTTIQEQSKLGSLSNTKKHYFGEELFQGNFTNKSQFRQNPSYLLKVGDTIHINIWGALEFQGDVPIDGKGNIFLPKIGVVALAGVTNEQLQPTLEEKIQKTFNENVHVYANVRAYQALSVYISGAVKKVGLYDGVANDSILQFLDKAGGIISGVGSYRNIDILRENQVVKHIDLYAFLLDGYRDRFHFQQGDTILVNPLKHYVQIDGDVARPYIFELKGKKERVSRLIKYALPYPNVNRFTHIKRQGMEEFSTEYKITQSKQVRVKSGEKIFFSANSHLESFSISVEGEHEGVRYVSVSKGTSLYTLLQKINFTDLSHIKSTQLFRKSVAKQQKSLLETNLKELESRVLISDSATPEEAAIRAKEKEGVLEFIKRAQNVQFKGQIILSSKEDLRNVLLEDGDRVYIPKRNNLVTIQGEVNIPTTLTYKTSKGLDYYIEACGGYTSRANSDEVLIVKSNGKVQQYNTHSDLEQGDSILVLGKTQTKNLILTKDITQIIYQVAVGAAVVLNAF